MYIRIPPKTKQNNIIKMPNPKLLLELTKAKRPKNIMNKPNKNIKARANVDVAFLSINIDDCRKSSKVILEKYSALL